MLACAPLILGHGGYGQNYDQYANQYANQYASQYPQYNQYQNQYPQGYFGYPPSGSYDPSSYYGYNQSGGYNYGGNQGGYDYSQQGGGGGYNQQQQYTGGNGKWLCTCLWASQGGVPNFQWCREKVTKGSFGLNSISFMECRLEEFTQLRMDNVTSLKSRLRHLQNMYPLVPGWIKKLCQHGD